MPSKRRKKIFYLLLSIFIIYSIWLGFQLLRAKYYFLPSKTASSLEVQGVYHIHSKFSDGWKTADAIARVAARSGLDFIILTDHGKPNRESIAFQGKKEGILVLAGSELSVNRGHMAALGFSPPSTPFSSIAEEANLEIKSQGGFSVICHPYSKVSWSWGRAKGYSGIEIMNGDTMLKKGLIKSLPYLPALIVNSRFAVLKMIDYPEKNLRKWDMLGQEYSLKGYFAADAHFLYRPAFEAFRIHVILNKSLAREFEKAKNQIFSSLENGYFYNAIESAAQASGFRYWAEKEEKISPMGSQVKLVGSSDLRILVPFPFKVETMIIHNGNIILKTPEKEIIHKVTQPGIYRVEVYLRERTPLNKNIPWIVSNPIFLR